MATAKTVTPVHPETKEPAKMATATQPAADLDLNKMDLAALKKLVDSASEVFATRKQGELKTLVNGWIAKAEAVGYSVSDVLDEVRSRMPAPPAPKARAARGSKPKGDKKFMDADSTGARPEIGQWYRLPSGITWQKKSKIGATNKNFVEAIHDETNPTTWEKLKIAAPK